MYELLSENLYGYLKQINPLLFAADSGVTVDIDFSATGIISFVCQF